MNADTNPSDISTEVVLEAEGLTKHFVIRRRGREVLTRTSRSVHAVDDVDLTLCRGHVTALVGESGSGKSTVARLLAQLYPRTGGDIRLHGASVTVRGGRKFRAYCRQVQMIFQDPFASLNPTHTIRYHLTRALRVHGRAGNGDTELRAALHDLLNRVQLTPPERYLAKFPHELSGGQRQRVAIARALAANPAALLADEPVSMLDVSIRLGVLNLLRDLKERLRLAILYITHDIASARYFADDTLVMYAGRMVEGGDSETVTQRPAHPYTRLLIDSAPDPDRITGATGIPSTPGTSSTTSTFGASSATDASSATGASGTTGPFVASSTASAFGPSVPSGAAGASGAAVAAAVDESGGEPPSLIAPPSGCRFHPRCPHEMAKCSTELPPRFGIGDADGHWAACWLYEAKAGMP